MRSETQQLQMIGFVNLCSTYKDSGCLGIKLKRKNMKHFRKELWFEIKTRRAFINITPDVETCLQESGIQNGLLLCNTKQI